MSTLGKAVIEFSAETAKFTGDVGRAAAMFEKNMIGMQRAVDGLLGKLGVAGGIAGFGLMVKGAMDLADHTFKASQKLGLTTEQVSELSFAFKLADVEQAEFVKGFGKFEMALVKAANSTSIEAKVFKALGIEITKGPMVAFRQLADVMSKMPKDSELTNALAKTLMGKGGAEMIPGMLDGSRGFDEMAAKARNLGVVISEELGRASQKFNDDMKILGERSTALGILLARNLLPVLGDVADRLARAAEHGSNGFWTEAFRTAQRFSATITPDWMLEKTGMQDYAVSLFDTPGMVKPSGGQNVNGRIRGLKPPEFVGPPKPTEEQLRKLRDALAHNDESARKAAAELLKYEGVAQNLTKQLYTLNNEGDVAIMVYELTVGTLKDLTLEHKAWILSLAGELEEKKRNIEMSKQAVAAWEAQVAVFEKSREAIRDLQAESGAANRKQLDDLAFELSLIGKTAREQEILNEMRKIDLETRKRIASLPNDDSEQTSRAMIEIMDESERQKKLVGAAIAERQKKERDWLTGAKSGLQEYADAAMNSAQNAAGFFTSAFSKMEDALVEFAMTGKLNFRDLANSIIQDIIRIQIRESITGPAAKFASNFLGDALKSIFGGGRASGGPIESGKWYIAGEHGPEPIWGGGPGAFAAGYGGGGSSVVIHQNIRVDSRSDISSVREAMVAAKDAAVAEVYETMRRGDRP